MTAAAARMVKLLPQSRTRRSGNGSARRLLRRWHKLRCLPSPHRACRQLRRRWMRTMLLRVRKKSRRWAVHRRPQAGGALPSFAGLGGWAVCVAPPSRARVSARTTRWRRTMPCMMPRRRGGKAWAAATRPRRWLVHAGLAPRGVLKTATASRQAWMPTSSTRTRAELNMLPRWMLRCLQRMRPPLQCARLSGRRVRFPPPAACCQPRMTRKLLRFWAAQKLAEAALRARPDGAASVRRLRRDVFAAAGVGDCKHTRAAAEEALSRCVRCCPHRLSCMPFADHVARLLRALTCLTSRRLTASRRFELDGDTVRLVSCLDDDAVDE